MERIRTIIQTYTRWQDLEIYPQRIETFLESDFILAIENGKSFIETICKTILQEQNEPFDNNETVNRLTRKTLKIFGLSAGEQISQFGQGIVSALQNIGEIRNRIGDTSHGRSLQEIRRNRLESLSAQFLINSIECIACFLIEFYETEFPKQSHQVEVQYTDFQDFNDYLDDKYSPVFIDLYDFLASEILFHLDNTAYMTEYSKYIESQNETD